MIDPFYNPTGSVAKHISSVGLKINIWPIVIFCWEYFAMSEVGSLRKLLFYQLCRPSIY